jgi:hypothetical protein
MVFVEILLLDSVSLVVSEPSGNNSGAPNTGSILSVCEVDRNETTLSATLLTLTNPNIHANIV